MKEQNTVTKLLKDHKKASKEIIKRLQQNRTKVNKSMKKKERP